jgi:hypothetical protein
LLPNLDDGSQDETPVGPVDTQPAQLLLQDGQVPVQGGPWPPDEVAQFVRCEGWGAFVVVCPQRPRMRVMVTMRA